MFDPRGPRHGGKRKGAFVRPTRRGKSKTGPRYPPHYPSYDALRSPLPLSRGPPRGMMGPEPYPPRRHSSRPSYPPNTMPLLPSYARCASDRMARPPPPPTNPYCFHDPPCSGPYGSPPNRFRGRDSHRSTRVNFPQPIYGSSSGRYGPDSSSGRYGGGLLSGPKYGPSYSRLTSNRPSSSSHHSSSSHMPYANSSFSKGVQERLSSNLYSGPRQNGHRSNSHRPSSSASSSHRSSSKHRPSNNHRPSSNHRPSNNYRASSSGSRSGRTVGSLKFGNGNTRLSL